MKHLKSYRIQFSGLSIGKHDFSFDIDKRFFDCYEYSIVKDGKLTAEVILDRQPSMMLVDFRIRGGVGLVCDVCLKEFDWDIDIDAHLIVKFTDEDLSESTDDILVLSKNDYEFSVADMLYEYINLAVPTYVRCDDAGGEERCDEQMIDVLKKLAPEENPEADNEDKGYDPRWESLEKLKRNN